MSAPSLHFREAEYLGLSFLAVSTSELLEQVLGGRQLDEDEKHTLLRARRFLEEASNGALLVTSGVHSNVSAADTVRKLSYSVEPLKVLQHALKAADADVALKQLAKSIEDVVQAHRLDRDSLSIARDFFQQLHLFFVTLIEKGKRRTGLDQDLGSSLMAHA